MSNGNFLKELDKFMLDAVMEVKQAEERGETSHPSDNADDGNQTASTGSRAAEHEKDVKAQVPGQTVNEAKGSEVAGPGRGENTPALHTVMDAKATGEAPAVETESAKGKPENTANHQGDETKHPAKADMGEKFSAAQLKNIGDEILADVAVASAVKSAAVPCAASVKTPVEAPKKKEDKPVVKAASEESKAEEKAETPAAEAAEEKAEEKAEAKSEAAGKEAAAAVINALAQPVVSQEEIINSIIKTASVDADNVADFLAGYMSKKSMDAGDTGDTVMEETSEGGPAAGAPAGDPAAGGGAPSEAEMEQIVQALLQAGVSPEELLALVSGGEGQGGAAPADAAMAGMPPVDAGAMGGAVPPEMMAGKAAALRVALKQAVAIQSQKGE